MAVSLASVQAASENSGETEACLECHRTVSPGIVADWKKSWHAKTTPTEAVKKDPKSLKVSAQKIPSELGQKTVGCAECHTLRSERHGDAFEHNGFKVHIVVAPEDCATCHPAEVEQYGKTSYLMPMSI